MAAKGAALLAASPFPGLAAPVPAERAEVHCPEGTKAFRGNAVGIGPQSRTLGVTGPPCREDLALD